MKTRIALLIALCLTITVAVYAQERSTVDVRDNNIALGLRAGHNATFGSFTASSLQTVQTFRNVSVEAGVQYNTIGRTAIEARPAYTKSYGWGKVSAEALVAYSNMANVNTFSAGAGVDVSSRWVGGNIGYYYRIFGNRGNKIQEPFNIFYELRVNLLAMLKSWSLQFVITNNEMFELERHYQPTFILRCGHDLMERLGISAGVGCKPAGVFSISAEYYQTFINFGVCYKW